MRTLLQLCLVSLSIAFVSCLQPPATRADALAVGRMGADSDWSTFAIRRGTGGNCVSVIAGPVVNPGTAPACSFGVDFYTVNGRGNTAFKNPPTSASTFSNSATSGGTTSFGTANWSYTHGALLDTAGYAARTSIIPRPAPVFPPTFLARATAFDPLEFDVTSSGMLGFSAILEELELAIEDPNGESGVGADYFYDGSELFNFHLIAPSGFTGIGDLDIFYRSVLGAVFDAQQLLDIIANLTVDPVLGTVSLATPFTLFPRTEFPYDPGLHELSGGLVANVEAALPAPGSMILFAFGALVLLRRAVP